MNKRMEKKQNLIRIITMFRRHGGLTQARLKEFTGLQASTVSYLVGDLKRSGILLDNGQEQQEGRVGKPGSALALNADFAVMLGLYVEDNRIVVYRIGMDGVTQHTEEIPLKTSDVKSVIIKTVEDQLSSASNIRGVGIAMKGIVYADGSIRSGYRRNVNGENMEWNFSGLLMDLQKEFPNIPIVAENDANCAAELFFHIRKMEVKTYAVYLMNWQPFGIGCGLMLDGKIHRGATGAAGEMFEHGNRYQNLSRQISLGEATVVTVAEAMVPHMLQTTYLLDPQMLVVAGNVFKEITEQAHEDVKRVFSRLPIPVEVACGDSLNPAKGAALLVTRKYLDELIEEVMKQ